VIARAGLPALVAAALALGGPALAGEGVAAPAALRTALDPLRVAGVAAGLAELVEERICAALAEASGGDVVCPSDVAAAAALAKTAMVFGECRSDECLRRVEVMRSADRRVAGSLERSERGLVLSLRLTSTQGAGPSVVEVLPEDVDLLVARVPAAVRKLFPER
jgi:hypothetical protein